MATKYSIYICEDAIGTKLDDQEDVLFWRADHPKLRLLSASLELEINKAGKLTFQMPYNHPYASKVHKRKTRFYVDRNGAPIWSGRVLDTQKTFYKAIQVTVEGALTYFLDTIQRPYNFDKVLNLATSTGNYYVPPTQDKPDKLPAKHLLYYLIHEHNKDADPDKKIVFNINTDIISTNETDDFNDESIKKKFKSDEYPNTKEELNTQIISAYSGFILLKYNKSTHKNRLIYCISEEGLESKNPQTIEFGQNMTDFTELVTSEGIYTRCIPIGATYNDIENLRKKAYDAEKKAYNNAINDYNQNQSEQKKKDKAAAEAKKKAAEDDCGYTKYKKDLAEYNKLKYQYDLGQINTKPTKPKEVSPPKTPDGRTKTLKDYGYDSKDPKYDRIASEDKLDNWEDSGFAMPSDIDKNTKITLNTMINLWYRTPWSVTINSNVDDFVVYSEDDLTRYGKVTKSVDLSVPLPKSLPSTEGRCKAVWESYLKSLKSKGKAWLKKNRRLNTTLTLNAIDLAHLTDSKVDHIDCGYSIPVSSPIHGVQNKTKWDDIDFGSDSNLGIDIDLLCSASTLNLISPGESEYTIGAVFKALTDKSVANKEQSGKAYGLARSSYSL